MHDLGSYKITLTYSEFFLGLLPHVQHPLLSNACIDTRLFGPACFGRIISLDRPTIELGTRLGTWFLNLVPIHLCMCCMILGLGTIVLFPPVWDPTPFRKHCSILHSTAESGMKFLHSYSTIRSYGSDDPIPRKSSFLIEKGSHLVSLGCNSVLSSWKAVEGKGLQGIQFYMEEVTLVSVAAHFCNFDVQGRTATRLSLVSSWRVS
ncbi:hypothetical protein VNO77_03371 [Canavalia gladiata]|uniref:Uncharacterized protein n=1 Tax=Canavalia gladiata TaxID=3824 RepID=A0AAN9MVD9_CANGL